MPTTDVISRVAQWLESLWTDPAAAAEFAESPSTSLANFDLSQSDLSSVDLRSVAGGLGGSAGISPDGRTTLTQFANSPSSGGGGGGGGGFGGGGHQVHEVAVVTQRVHHDNPQVVKVFNDNSQHFNIDNSTTFVNNGTIGGDISFDNDVNVATKGGVVNSQIDGNAVTGTQGSVVAGGDVTQAKNSTVLQDSGNGNGQNQGGQGQGDQGRGDQGHDQGRGDQVPDNEGHDGQGRGDEGHDQQPGDQGHGDQGHDQQPGDHHGDQGHDGQPDLPFGEGETGQDEGHGDEAQGRHDGHGDEGQGDEGHDGDRQDDVQHPDEPTHDGGQDPTAAAEDPTLAEGHDDQGQGQHFEHQPVPEADHDGADTGHDSGHEVLHA